jgi:signal transduction histidine kinase
LAEIDAPAKRPHLLMGVWSGYTVAVLLLALALVSDALGVVTWSTPFYVLLAIKALTNTGTWIALRTETAVLPVSALNTVTDLVLMTAAIYFTGGPLSPLFAVYVIEIGAIALLTNVAVTVLVASLSLLLYALMNVALLSGLLAPLPPPVETVGGLSTAYVIADIGLAALLLGVPTVFTSAIVGQLRAKDVALTERTRRLIEASEAKARFMATVTHELRTPLHGILGLAELLETGLYGPMTGEQSKATADIRSSTRHLQQLIEDLLELTRADAGKLEVRRTEVALGDLVSQVIASARWMLESKGDLALQAELAPDLPTIVSDPRLLASILVNLLSNAVKFTPHGGCITVRAGAAAAGVWLEVEDTGIGIAPDQRERIFEAFRQVDDSVERAFGGVGLGLALVRRLTGVLGGDVTLRSAVGQGSCFRVDLPLAARPAAPQTA